MESAVLLYHVENGVARVTLNRPDQLNALNPDLLRALDQAFNAAAADPTARVVLLNGAGKGFCAGADMQVLSNIADNQAAKSEGARAPATDTKPTPEGGKQPGRLRFEGIGAMSKPVIAAIHGACAGVGLSIACAANVRIAASNAFFVSPFVKLGLCAESGQGWHLPRLMGPGHAAEFLLSGRKLAADEALAKGLVSLVMPGDGFEPAAIAYAEKMATGSPQSFTAIIDQVAKAIDQDFVTAQALSDIYTVQSLRHSDFREAMRAKRDGRAPSFEPVSSKFGPAIFNG